jgi:hypothetical protein
MRDRGRAQNKTTQKKTTLRFRQADGIVTTGMVPYRQACRVIQQRHLPTISTFLQQLASPSAPPTPISSSAPPNLSATQAPTCPEDPAMLDASEAQARLLQLHCELHAWLQAATASGAMLSDLAASRNCSATLRRYRAAPTAASARAKGPVAAVEVCVPTRKGTDVAAANCRDPYTITRRPSPHGTSGGVSGHSIAAEVRTPAANAGPRCSGTEEAQCPGACRPQTRDGIARATGIPAGGRLLERAALLDMARRAPVLPPGVHPACCNQQMCLCSSTFLHAEHIPTVPLGPISSLCDA